MPAAIFPFVCYVQAGPEKTGATWYCALSHPCKPGVLDGCHRRFDKEGILRHTIGVIEASQPDGSPAFSVEA
jgi:hypothetical protein